MPDKHKGITDIEFKSRQRYVDLFMDQRPPRPSGVAPRSSDIPASSSPPVTISRSRRR